MEQVIEIGIITAVIAVVLFSAIGLISKLFLPKPAPAKAPSESETHIVTEKEADPDVEFFENYPRCEVCGDLATAPMPQVVRKRAGVLRLLVGLLSLPVMYRRKVDAKHGQFRLCQSDAHAADAEIDLFLAREVRGEQAKLNHAIARKVAQFETTLSERLKAEKDRQRVPDVSSATTPSVSSLRSLRPAVND